MSTERDKSSVQTWTNVLGGVSYPTNAQHVLRLKEAAAAKAKVTQQKAAAK